MKKTAYNVATKVLIAQAKTTLRDLTVEVTKQRRDDLVTVGLNADAFTAELEQLTAQLQDAEGAQERAKGAYHREADQDQERAEAGYRYKLALDARVRAYLATHDDAPDLASIFRFGKLRGARARGVIYELRSVLPDALAMVDTLTEVGIDATYVERGYSLLAGLEADHDETADMASAREMATKQVRMLELQVSQQLARLMAADEAIALEKLEEGPVFSLDIIRTEEARLAAVHTSRVLANPGPVVTED